MQTGALIVAAGMSSRMGDFKPMLAIGSISIAQRIVANFRQAGTDKIVMVTGFNATALERHLAGNGIVFLRNEEYEHTQMFDSVRIGLDYLKDKVDVVFFTPVDIPLFSSSTLTHLLDSGASIACPTYGGEDGHPIMISSDQIDAILKDSGSNGLKGAIESCPTPMVRIPVDDPGILRDADTPDDYAELLKLHNSGLIRPEISVSLSKEVPFFDEKLAMLLSLVDETNSVRLSCQRMQISYSSGWNLIRTLESQLSRTLIERTQGGSHGGKSYLTDAGRQLLKKYTEYSDELRKISNELFARYFGGEFDE